VTIEESRKQKSSKVEKVNFSVTAFQHILKIENRGIALNKTFETYSREFHFNQFHKYVVIFAKKQ